MPIPLTAAEVLNREFLEMRAKILELAASFDRLDRAAGDIENDVRTARLKAGVSLLLSEDPGRAERVQMLFSREYDQAWQTEFQISPRSR